MQIIRIGFGGGCHWCTEAVFATLLGIETVEQGWVSSTSPNEAFSEAVIVSYHPEIISLKELIHIHLLTHASTSNHSMRNKYRSAIYWFNEFEKQVIEQIIAELQEEFDQSIITLVLPFANFKPSLPVHQNYYYSNPEKPFCQLYINPKLNMLREKFTQVVVK